MAVVWLMPLDFLALESMSLLPFFAPSAPSLSLDHLSPILFKLVLLLPFGIQRYCTDSWGAYQRLPVELHKIGKRKTQTIEHKHLRLRTPIQRLAGKTICFSNPAQMHDLVLGLLINCYEFALPV